MFDRFIETLSQQGHLYRLNLDVLLSLLVENVVIHIQRFIIMLGLDLGLLLSLLMSFVSALGWYRSLVRLSYRREQDSELLLELSEGVDALSDRLSRLEILLLKQSRDA